MTDVVLVTMWSTLEKLGRLLLLMKAMEALCSQEAPVQRTEPNQQEEKESLQLESA